MGQYYQPTSVDKLEFVYSHDFGEGLKLMEHSWKGNKLVKIVENLLSKGQAWHKNRLVWAGDYAEPELCEEKNLYNIADKIKPNMALKELDLLLIVIKRNLLTKRK